MKILFLGSPLFSRIVLEKLLQSQHQVVAVITQPDRPSGRGHQLMPTDVKRYALDKGIPVYAFQKIRDSIEEIRKIDYDYAITASFGQILPTSFLEYRPCINVHPSLLPKYRGATPIQNALLNDDKISGVTIMRVVQEVDAGDILLQRTFPISNNETYEDIMPKLAEMGGEMAVEAFDMLEKGNATFLPQRTEDATFVSLLHKEDGQLDFRKNTRSLICQMRALSGNLGCYFVLQESKIKVKELQDVSESFQGSPGEVILSKKRLVIATGDGAVEILSCQAPNGKMMPARDFLNGFHIDAGAKVCLPI